MNDGLIKGESFRSTVGLNEGFQFRWQAKVSRVSFLVHGPSLKNSVANRNSTVILYEIKVRPPIRNLGKGRGPGDARAGWPLFFLRCSFMWGFPELARIFSDNKRDCVSNLLSATPVPLSIRNGITNELSRFFAVTGHS